MINRTNALQILQQNLQRTESLIEAMEKIQAYNRIYQMKTAEDNADFAAIVTQAQNEQLAKIEQSCAEHAIISLATAFETYYKELLQQLLFEFPEFFASQQTNFTDQITAMIKEKHRIDYEEIEERLKLRNRFDHYQLFSAYSVPLLTPQDVDFIEYIYVKRNRLVHHAGKITKRNQTKLGKIKMPFDVASLKTESKKLRTKFTKIMMQVHQRVTKTIGDRHRSASLAPH
jgi:hypothetical protein